MSKKLLKELMQFLWHDFQTERNIYLIAKALVSAIMSERERRSNS